MVLGSVETYWAPVDALCRAMVELAMGSLHVGADLHRHALKGIYGHSNAVIEHVPMEVGI